MPAEGRKGGLFRKNAGGTPLAGIDVVLADLDGVLYAGPDAIPYAVESLTAAQRAGIRVGCLTNNAARTDRAVADHLSQLGFEVRPDDVVTSPQAAMRLLVELIEPGSTVMVVGGDGLVAEVDKAGFEVTRSAHDKPVAVVQGFAPEVGWLQLAEASFALADEAVHWVATNTDWTIPQARGVAPGNGTLVSAVHTAVGRLPVVAGKPERPMYDLAVERFGAASPLAIGDRLDTDILGANRAGIPSVLVLTGIDKAKQVLAAGEEERPRYLLADLRELDEPYPEPKISRSGDAVRVREASVRLEGSAVRIVDRGSSEIDLLRAASTLIWNSGRPIYALEVPEELYA
ncbi:HAD-IIA family hydrolase [Humibacter ginsenosidimutans]|uniref:HAD-IIA family hydrolase n=1 Tax=Humibacter ginsenosidimutans TaxID=2599293 RepID=A0A5B8M1G8_9MICO|nr:HAD-IIA family hydrolase [Humibacter ginsenosidimutans]QDZ13552.1 HAD-IIA family hydrolase [Humibacter ginsenosidimutans]